MNINLTPFLSKNKRPRISKGTLVATTNPARLACMNVYTTFYLFKPVSYKIVRKIIVENKKYTPEYN